MPFGMVQDFDFHPYEADVRVCTFPEAGVLRADAEALVCHAAYDQVVLRHYAFADRWFKVNVTTDPDGNLIEVPAGDGRSAYAFTIDIATPMVVAGNATYSVDLDIDVLVRADTVTMSSATRRRSRSRYASAGSHRARYAAPGWVSPTSCR